MQPNDVAHYYPKLYHIAWGGSWPSIKKYGLLSTKALLREYGKSASETAELTRKRRPHWVEIDCPGRPPAVLRDQKPMKDNELRKALPPDIEPWQWYDRINSMVFFWPTKKRLERMLHATAYKEINHAVLVVDTETLVNLEEPNIRLSPINSGSTYRSFPRDLTLFKRIQDFPFDERLQKQGRERAVAEICVMDRVDTIREAVVGVECGLAAEILANLAQRSEP